MPPSGRCTEHAEVGLGGLEEPLNDMMKKIWIQLLLCPILVIFGASVNAEEKNIQKAPNEKDYCVICHEQQPKGDLKKPVAEWRAGVHAVKGEKCGICHGGDPGIDDKIKAKSKALNYIGRPNKKKISEFCGREGCHTVALEQFKQGPHYLSVQKSGEPGCTTCHGVHNIKRSSIGTINERSCTACHSAEYSKGIIAHITRIDRGINNIDKNIALLVDIHTDVRGIQDRLNRARLLFHRFVHVLSRQDMESTKNILEIEITSLDNETKSKVASIQRIDMLYIIMVIFCLGVIAGFLIYIIVMYSRRKK
jgi:hypothetical protein